MRKYMRRLSILIITLLLGACALAEDVTLESRSIVVMDISGEVYFSTGGRAEFPAKAGVTLRAGFSVRTGNDGEAYLMIDDDKLVKLAPNSDMVVSQADSKLVVTMRAGELVFNITKRQAEGSVEFLSGGVSMGIRGTSGYLKRVKDALASAIECGLFDGEVSLRARKLMVLIEAMEVNSIPMKGASAFEPGNGSPFALLSALDERLYIGLPDDFLDDDDIELLKRLWEAELAEANTPDEEGARRYLTDAEIIVLAQDAIALIEYENQPYTSTEQSLKAYINELLAPIAEEYAVTTRINTIKLSPPKNGDADYPGGASGKYDFNVTVTRNAATDEAVPQAIVITPNPYAGTPNTVLLERYKADVEVMEIAPLNQADAPDEAAIQAYIIGNIADELNDGEVIISLNCELVEPIAGDADNIEGVEGSYTYSVTLKRGIHTTTTGNKVLPLMPTRYAGTPNFDLIYKYMALIDELEFEPLNQADAPDEAAVQAYIESVIADTIGDDEVIITLNGELTPPKAGDIDYPEGESGEYVFTVKLMRGVQSMTSGDKTLVINATPYTGTSYAKMIEDYISALSGVTLAPITQAQAVDEAAIKTHITDEIMSVLSYAYPDYDAPDISVSRADIEGAWTAPIAGTPDEPEKHDGAYAFIAALTLGAHSADTPNMAIVITATAFTGETNQQLAERLAGIISNATFSASQSNVRSKEQARAYILHAAKAIADNYAELYTLEIDTSNNYNSSSSFAPSYTSAPQGEYFTPAYEGDADYTPGTYGYYQCRLKVIVGTKFANTGVLYMQISPIVYEGESNESILTRAIAALDAAEDAWTVTKAQAADEEQANEIILEIAQRIATGVDAGITCTIFYDTGTQYIAPVEGDADYPAGTDGYYECTIVVNKSATGLPSRRKLTISAPYTGESNESILASQVEYAEGVNMGALSILELWDNDATPGEAVRATYQTAITNEFGDNKTSVTVNNVNYVNPENYEESNPDGQAGSFTYYLTLARGIHTKSTSSASPKTVAVLPYTMAQSICSEAEYTLNRQSLEPDYNTRELAMGYIFAYLSDIIPPAAEGEYGGTIERELCVVSSFTPAQAGDNAKPAGETGEIKFKLAVTAGATTAYSGTITMFIKPVAYNPEAILQAYIDALDAADWTVSQAEAPTSGKVSEYTLSFLQDMAQSVNEDIIIHSAEFASLGYTAPVEGTEFAPSGTNGICEFEVIVKLKDVADLQKQKSYMMTITATPYAGESTESKLTRQRDLAEGKNIAQLSKVDIGAATPGEAVASIYQSDVNQLVGDEYTSVSMDNVEYLPAKDFSNDLPDGENGMLTFYLKLVRGDLSKQTNSKSVVLLPYTMADSLCAYADRLLNNKSMQQPKDDSVAKAIEGVFAVLGNNINPDNPYGYGGTVALNESDVISYVPAVAGDTANPNGTHGEIVFTLSITAGTKTSRTGAITMQITPDPYTASP